MRETEGSVGGQDLVFFVDRSLGSKIVPGLLREAGLSVEVHDDHFTDPETPDEDWLRLVGRQGWIGFSADKNIRRSGGVVRVEESA